MDQPKVLRFRRTLTREFFEWRDGARVRVKPSELVDVEIEIDLAGLFGSLGRKAAGSVGGRAVIGGSLVVARRRK